MNPRINIGTIGHIGHGKTALTAVTMVSLSEAPAPLIVEPPADTSLAIASLAAGQYKPAPIVMNYRPRRSPMAAALALSFMCGGFAGLPGWSARNPSQQKRNDPRREKTRADLERMAAAQAKRDRKAARKGPSNDQGDGRREKTPPRQ